MSYTLKEKLNNFHNSYRYDLDKKEYYCVKISQLDYMLYIIEFGEFTDRQDYYKENYSLEELRNILSNKLIEYANSNNTRDLLYNKSKSLNSKKTKNI
jgi:predicted alpha/beta-fold hydrolase